MPSIAQWNGAPRPPGAAVVVDIDGVLSDGSGRQHFLKNPQGRRDWHGFFAAVGDDPPLVATRALLRLLPDELVVVLLSGRPNWVFDQTLEWLARHDVRWDLLILRGDGAISAATEFKRGVVRQLVAQGFDLRFAFDDDDRTVRMFDAEGIPALYVHSGYYGERPTP